MNGTGGFLRPEEIIKKLNIKNDSIIADFGCGAGYFTIPLARTAEDGEVHAFDVLEEALESVRSRARLEGFLNIKTKRCDLEIYGNTGLESDSVDFVLLANILFQTSKKSDIIKETKRILKQDGELVVIDWKQGFKMGPPDKLIVSQEEVKKIIQQEKLIFKKEIPIDNYHWGMVFKK